MKNHKSNFYDNIPNYTEDDDEIREENLRDEDETKEKEKEADKRAKKKKLHEDSNVSNISFPFSFLPKREKRVTRSRDRSRDMTNLYMYIQ